MVFESLGDQLTAKLQPYTRLGVEASPAGAHMILQLSFFFQSIFRRTHLCQMLGTTIPCELTSATPHCRRTAAHRAWMVDERRRAVTIHDEGRRGERSLGGERGKEWRTELKANADL